MKRKSLSKIAVLGALFTVALALGAAKVLRGSSTDKAEGRIVAVTRGEVRISVDEVGMVEPFRKVDLKSKIAGQVSEVLVDVGARVKAGDPLIRLDPRDAKRELALAVARGGVDGAALSAVQRQLELKQNAHAQGALSALELRTVQGEAGRLSAQLGVDAAEQQILRDRLGYTELRAPIDGVVLARNVQPGEMVTPGVAAMVDGRPLLVVAQVEKLLVRAELNQMDVTRLDLGKAVSVRVDAIAGWEFRGEIYRIAAMAQRSERRKDSNLMVFPIDVIVDTAQPQGERLRPGMMADISVRVDAHTGVLTVPLEALVRQGGRAQLRRLDARDAETLVDVAVGFQNERVAEIVSGVSEGDRIRVVPGKPAGES